jgi:hypothetical protein
MSRLDEMAWSPALALPAVPALGRVVVFAVANAFCRLTAVVE